MERKGTEGASRAAEPDRGEAVPTEAAPWASAHEALRHVPWLRSLPAASLDMLAAQAVLHRVPAGSQLFNQAETPAFAQILLAGSIELLGVRGEAETLVELLRPVDLVIPAAVIGGQPYLMRARVHEEAELLLIRADTFRDVVARDHALCLAVLGSLSAQFRRQVRHAKNLKLRSAEERVGCYLMALAESAAPDAAIRLPVEKRLIASQLGMTRETFSRALAGLARSGIVIVGDVMRIAEPAAARARFPLDPLIDGLEPIISLQDRKTRS